MGRDRCSYRAYGPRRDVDVNANVNQTFVTWLEQHNYYVDREGTVVTEPCWEKADEKRSVLRLRTTVFFCFSLKCTET